MKKAKKIKTYFYGFHIKSRSLLMIGKVVVVPCLKISNTVQNMKLLLGQPTLILIAPPSRGETRQSSVSLWYFFSELLCPCLHFFIVTWGAVDK